MQDQKFSIPCRCLITPLLVLSLLFACTDSDGPAGPDTTPELPPANSMLIPFDDFLAAGRPEPLPASPSLFENASARANFNFAATAIVFWNVAITVTMAVPVASFVEAFNHPIQRVEPGVWESTYTFRPLGGVLHTAVLQAKLVSDGVEWKMTISKENSFSDFVWYTGFSNLDNSEGVWHLNLDPAAPTPFLDIDWYRNSADSTAGITYTFVVPAAPKNGSTLSYGVTNETPYDAFYNIIDAENGNSVVIEWNRTDINGRVQSENHFGDADFRCWDTLDNDLQDITCP